MGPDRHPTQQFEKIPKGYGVVFTGTTLENYLKCAFVGDEGRVFFDKTREPRHYSAQTFCYSRLGRAHDYARFLADLLGHKPLTITGMVTKDHIDRYDSGFDGTPVIALRYRVELPVISVFLDDDSMPERYRALLGYPMTERDAVSVLMQFGQARR